MLRLYISHGRSIPPHRESCHKVRNNYSHNQTPPRYRHKKNAQPMRQWIAVLAYRIRPYRRLKHPPARRNKSDAPPIMDGASLLFYGFSSAARAAELRQCRVYCIITFSTFLPCRLMKIPFSGLSTFTPCKLKYSPGAF